VPRTPPLRSIEVPHDPAAPGRAKPGAQLRVVTEQRQAFRHDIADGHEVSVSPLMRSRSAPQSVATTGRHASSTRCRQRHRLLHGGQGRHRRRRSLATSPYTREVHASGNSQLAGESPARSTLAVPEQHQRTRGCAMGDGQSPRNLVPMAEAGDGACDEVAVRESESARPARHPLARVRP
jgi:hypothetical protein